MITIDWGTKVISVPQSYLTNVTGTLYELDTNQFRLDLKALEESVEGMAYERTHKHNTTVTIAGTTYARTVEIINGYSVEFEDGAYSVRLANSNNNIFDIQNGILVQNQVQVIPQNSAGLIQVTSGSGVLPSDIAAIADAVWDEVLADHLTAGSTGEALDAGGSGGTASEEEANRVNSLDINVSLPIIQQGGSSNVDTTTLLLESRIVTDVELNSQITEDILLESLIA